MPDSIWRTSCIRSIVVWRNASRLLMMLRKPSALEPSVESIVAIAVLIDAASAGGHRHRAAVLQRHTERAERAAAVADDVDRHRGEPADATPTATVKVAPYELSVKPWPKIATGHPPAGFGTGGQEHLHHDVGAALAARVHR